MFNFSIAAIRRIPSWLWQIRYFWLASAFTIVAVGVALYFKTEPSFRWAGLALQLAGGLTVWWSIAETHRSFGHPSFLKRGKTWLRSFPLIKQPPIVLSVSGSSQMNLSGGHIGIRHRLGLNATFDERLTALQQDFDRLYDRHVAFVLKTGKQHGEHERKLAEEARARQSDRQEIEKQIRENATGGLHIPSIGGAWILVGSLLGTLSVELATWVPRWLSL